MERFLEIQVEVLKFKTFEIKFFRNLNLAKISVLKITSYTVAHKCSIRGAVLK